jgi:hypothetical protein
MNWYSQITRDITNLPTCIDYFEDELINASSECRLIGNIEKAAAAMPGIVEHRYGQLQEMEAILEYLNIELRRIKAFHFRKYLETYNRMLSQKECDRFVEGEAEVVDFEKIINDFALVRNKWLGITKALDQKQWQITNIVKLRVAGMEDATI